MRSVDETARNLPAKLHGLEHTLVTASKRRCSLADFLMAVIDHHIFVITGHKGIEVAGVVRCQLLNREGFNRAHGVKATTNRRIEEGLT